MIIDMGQMFKHFFTCLLLGEQTIPVIISINIWITHVWIINKIYMYIYMFIHMSLHQKVFAYVFL
jgi:hypothetical protein